MSPPPSDSGCLDEGTLLGWVEGTLNAELKAQAQAHMEGCEACFSAIAEVHAVSVPTVPAGNGRRYTLGVELGRGGMGVVYRGRDELLCRDVAIKVLQGDWAARAHRERLLEESTTMARLRHPNVVAVHDVVVEDEQAFVVMEFVEGQTLRLWFETTRPGTAEVVRMFEQIGRGLEAAHQASVVHRDFKPENVLVGSGGRPQIVDFGIASTQVHHTRSDVTQSTSGEAADSDRGTPGYMAPEQRKGAEVDARADQYAFCVSLWEMLFGARPSESSAASREHGLPRVRRVLARGLQTRPEARYAEMGSLLIALERSQRSRWPWVAGCTAGAVALAAVSFAASGMVETEASRTCLEGVQRLGQELDRTELEAISEGLQARDGFRGKVLTQQAQRDIDSVSAGLEAAAGAACEAEDDAVRAVAISCLSDIDAQLRFIVEGAADGDLDLLHEIQRLKSSSMCGAVATERERSPSLSFWAHRAGLLLRPELAQAEVLARRSRPVGAEAGDAVAELAGAVGHADLRIRGLAASGLAVWDVEPERARANFEAATELASHGDNRFLEARVWTSWGLLSQDSWDTETVARSLNEARRAQSKLLQEPLRDSLEPNIALLAMISHLEAGQLDAAREQLEIIQDALESQPDRFPDFAIFDAMLAVLDGDSESALEALRVLLQWSRFNGLNSSADLARMHSDVAEHELDLGLFDDAAASIERASELVGEAKTPLAARRTVDCVSARGAAEDGDFEAAAARLAPHLAAIGTAELDPGAGETLSAWGGVLLREGRFTEAVGVLVRARTVSGLDAPEAIGGAIEVVVPMAIALRRNGQVAKARTLLTPLESWHRENYPKLITTGQATMTMGWLDVDDENYPAARDRFSAVRETQPRPFDRAWADFGYALSSTEIRGAAAAQEIALAQSALERFSVRAEAHRFEVDTIRSWLEDNSAPDPSR